MILASLIVVAVALDAYAVAWVLRGTPPALRSILGALVASRTHLRTLPARIVHRARQRLALSLLGAYLRVSGRDRHGLIPVAIPVREGR